MQGMCVQVHVLQKSREKRLAREQRKLSMCKRKPQLWRQKKKVARCHEKIRNQRKDYLHKLSRRILLRALMQYAWKI